MNFNTDCIHNESEFEDIRQYDEITKAETIYELLGDIIIIGNYKHNFDYLFNRVIDTAVLCWNNKDDKGDKLQHTQIRFKTSNDANVTYSLPLNRFMLSLPFLRPIIRYVDSININDLLVDKPLTKKRREDIQDKIAEILMSYGHGIKDVVEEIADMSLNLKQLNLIFSQADIQIYTADNLFLDHYKESELIRQINNVAYPADAQAADITEENKRLYGLLEKEMLRLGNPFFLHNKYTEIVKPKQMEELYINFSQIPDGQNIIPVIMNGNGFRAGYHGIDVFYAGAIAARVPDIINEDKMGSAGYFNRNLMILTYGTISKTVFDCGSSNPIPITVDEMVLDTMEGRYYYKHKGSNILHVLKKTDTDLIGQTLWFRSPCTCNLNEDVCHVCYGTVALKVGELEGGFIYTTEILTSNVAHNILKAKHILKANAEKIDFSENFDKFFMNNSSTIVPKNEKKFDIYLPEDYMDNISDHLTIYIGKELRPITISNYTSLHIPDNVTDNLKETTIDDITYYKISSYKVLDLGGTFCNIIPINTLMTKRYMDIMNLFEYKMSKYERIEDVIMALMPLIYKAIPILSVHGEIIISSMIKSAENKMMRPNWLNPNEPYQLTTLKTALKNAEGITTALSFEQARHHLFHNIFEERNQVKRVGPHSFADYLLGEEVL